MCIKTKVELLYGEDVIDHDCSDAFRDLYFERGLTSYHSPTYPHCKDRKPTPETVRALLIAASKEGHIDAIKELAKALFWIGRNQAQKDKGPDKESSPPTSETQPSSINFFDTL